MPHSLRFSLLAAALGIVIVCGNPPACASVPASADRRNQFGEIAGTVAAILEQSHFTRKKLSPQVSLEIFENYLRLLDPSRLYFLQSDVDELREKYGSSLNVSFARRDISPAFEIYDRYVERVNQRLAQVEKLIEKHWDFSSNRTVEINRSKASWPRDEQEAIRLWENRIEGELLGEHLNSARLDPPQKVLQRRYDQIRRSLREQDDSDVVTMFLTALANTYDPHSDYLSPSDLENFSIQMRLSLFGVGAVLRSDDGYARVVEIVPGGPADRDGRLRVGDRIAAVAQGDGEFEDTVDLKLDKVVQKIRGPKGTKVRLLVIPANATDLAQRQVIEIIRDEVQLRDQEAKAQLIEMPPAGSLPGARIGWITLPSFYSSNVDPRGGKGTRKSTTEDVAALLRRLMREGIDGLVIDLRRDGGGALEEAINLTGLFIPKGPVVQVKDSTGRVSVQSDTSGRTLYNGPLIVLMNRASASASEIFAAALQDYGRAIIVGDERSFGKGTVQQMVDVSRFLPLFSRGGELAGSLKLTVQKFYRVKGGSTQLRGVESDIVLPSPTDNPEIGEGALNNPLEYDEVNPLRIMEWPDSPFPFLEELRLRSARRVASEPEFQFILEDRKRLRERIEANTLSLNKAERKAEVEASEARQKERADFRRKRGKALNAVAYDLTLENVDAPELQKVAFERTENKQASLEVEEPGLAPSSESEGEKPGQEDSAPPVPDAIRIETLRIMQDLVNLMRADRTAATAP